MFDVNILVNGSRCKQYQHEGKTFIQANPGSEYVIEIKNDYYKRILAVCSVDGLDVLDGKPASYDDDGYVIDGYHSEKIKGFRLSDSDWALFKFGYKFNGKTYAQSKNDGSEKNVGVLGVRLFYEYEPITYTINTTTYPIINPSWPWPNGPYWTWTSGGTSAMSSGYSSNVQYGCCADGAGPKKSVLNNPIRACNMASDEPNINYCCSNNTSNIDMTAKIASAFQNAQPQPKGFDVGTEFGRKETSKVQSVQFTRGYLAHNLDIYYASRESLIEMGVPITKELKVNLPQSFPGKYCEPPHGWNG